MKNYIYIPVENCPIRTKRFVIAKVNDKYKLEFCGAEEDDAQAHAVAKEIIGAVIIDTAMRVVL